jgi:hypothetical protein
LKNCDQIKIWTQSFPLPSVWLNECQPNLASSDHAPEWVEKSHAALIASFSLYSQGQLRLPSPSFSFYMASFTAYRYHAAAFSEHDHIPRLNLS